MSMEFETLDGTHQVAADYIELIKKKTKGGQVRYDSGDFLALDQHDRKRVVQSLLEFEQGNRILVTLKTRIQKSEMSDADKVELAVMIEPIVIEAVPTSQIFEVIKNTPIHVVETKEEQVEEAKASETNRGPIGRFLSWLGGK